MEFQDRQQQIGKIANEHVGDDAIVEPVPDWLKTSDSLETSKRFFNGILAEVVTNRFFFGQTCIRKQARVTIEFLRFIQG